MPYTKEYFEKNKEIIYQRNRESYFKNKEKYNNKRRENYKNKGSRYEQIVKKTWKVANIITFDDTFEKFNNLKNCELCNVEFCAVGGKTVKNKKVLDHCHFSNYARFIICHSCNIKNRKKDNLKMKLHLELYRYFNLK
tara:strand:+ start:635 stop:1048 length:414 start_codon:yes stop_codon:yes gene_type:complete